MKFFFNTILLVILFVSCSKKQSEISYPDETSNEPKYDTTAIDSFSAGAIPEAVARQIKMSSKQYQDSVKQAKEKAEEELRLKEEKEKLEKIAKDEITKDKEKEQITEQQETSSEQ